MIEYGNQTIEYGNYFCKYAAAYIRGVARNAENSILQDVLESKGLGDKTLEELSDEEMVLEHIPDVEKAVVSAVRIAKKHVVVTVPSTPDNNPEHIHLLTRQRLTKLFRAAGCTRLRFDGVNGHLFMVATVGETR